MLFLPCISSPRPALPFLALLCPAFPCLALPCLSLPRKAGVQDVWEPPGKFSVPVGSCRCCFGCPSRTFCSLFLFLLHFEPLSQTVPFFCIPHCLEDGRGPSGPYRALCNSYLPPVLISSASSPLQLPGTAMQASGSDVRPGHVFWLYEGCPLSHQCDEKKVWSWNRPQAHNELMDHLRTHHHMAYLEAADVAAKCEPDTWLWSENGEETLLNKGHVTTVGPKTKRPRLTSPVPSRGVGSSASTSAVDPSATQTWSRLIQACTRGSAAAREAAREMSEAAREMDRLSDSAKEMLEKEARTRR